MDDTEIIELYWQRSEAAITETAAKYGAYCRRIAYGILENTQDTEECLNDTWLAAWNAMPPHRPQVLKTFLGKLSRRLSLMRLRSQNRLKRGSGEAALALEELEYCIGTGDVERELEEKELTQAVNCFLSSLPVTERDLFVCRYWYLASVKELAHSFGYSESKVKSMLFRTRGKLRGHLEKEGYI